MRRASYKTDWLVEDTNYMGINLGADFTSEHERGIKKIYQLLSVKDDANICGIHRRIITNAESIKLIEEEDSSALIACDKRYHEGCTTIDSYSRELSFYKEDLVCAWSQEDFGIRVRKEKNLKRLRRLYRAILEKDAAIWLGGGHVFENAGLNIGIVSTIPLHLKKQMYDADVDYNKLVKADDNTSICKRIDEFNREYIKKTGDYDAPCSYFALSPAWANGRKTKHSVIYWLNPRHQDVNNSNWFTVEDLKLWMEGKGPVLKTNSQTAKR